MLNIYLTTIKLHFVNCFQNFYHYFIHILYIFTSRQVFKIIIYINAI